MTTMMPPADKKSSTVTGAQQPAAKKGVITFELFAPTINGAVLIGDFSQWKDIPMKKDDKGYWRTEVSLPDGDHRYRFRIQSKSWFYKPDEWKTITDPKATRVDPTHNDEGILRVRNGVVSIDEYQWKHDLAILPPNNELIIYELHVADFSGGEADPFARGKFKHVTEKLDYLLDLGINAIELLPIKEYPGDYSWGYTPQYLYAPESAYGPLEDLKNLVDEAHKRGIRMIFDGVYNHAHTDTPLAQIDHDYWFHHEPKHKENSWGPQYNYEHTDPNLKIMPASQFITENVEYWVKNFHIDGLRYDAAGEIDNFDALHQFSETARKARGIAPFINIAECTPERPDMVGTPDTGRPMDSAWHEYFFWGFANDVISHGNLDMEKVKNAIHPMRRGYTDCTQVVNYISNHDHMRLMPHLAKSKVFDDEAFRRAKLAATVLFTAVGLPMIWMGEEFADYHPKTQEQAKIDWTLLKNENNQKLHDHYKSLITMRKQNNALRRNDLEFFYEHVEDGILAFTRWDEGGNQVVVVLNLKGNQHGDYKIPNFPRDGLWHAWTYNVDTEIKDRTWIGHIDPWEAKVFVAK